MAKLPTVQDLGPTPRADPSRPMASTLAGGQAYAEAVRHLGEGVSKFGEGVGELSLDESRWDYAKAHADFLSRKVERDSALSEDRNYGPDEDGKSMPERYEKDVNDLRTQSASLIRSGPMRERFMQETAPTVAHGVATAQKHAKNLSDHVDLGYTLEQGTNFINKGVDAQDDETRKQLIDTYNHMIDGLAAKGAITPDHAVGMKQAWAHQFATALALRNAEQNPEATINELRARPGSNEAITNRILQIEGTGKNAKSSATGAGQFIDSTWLDVLKRNRPDLVQGKTDQELLALRGDKRLGRDMTEAYRSENAAYLSKKGVEPTPGAQYLAHFLGPTGAAAVLKGDPNKPVVDVLAATIGRQKAQAMVDANPTILQGQLAGSVKQWSNNKMGGQVPGGGSIYDQLRPDVREQLLAHARTQLQKQTVNDLSGFRQRYQDTVAEAYNNPEGPKQPMTMGDFVHSIGAEKAKVAYESYKGELDLASDMHKVESMTPAEMQDLYESYTPKAGTPGYKAAADRQDTIERAISKVNEARKHPAELAANKLPASKEAWSNFMSASPEDRPAAARDYASKALLEQQRVDIPAEQRAILPKSYLDNIKKQITTVADADDPKARVNLIGRIKQERELWGSEYWPQVMRQIAPDVQPIVRAIAADADETAMARLLSLDPKAESPHKILKEQNETKFRDMTKELNDAMAPFRKTMVGRQLDRDYTPYYGLGEKLAALYVRDGKDAKTAASDAFNHLVGNRYDFKDTWRMPKTAGVSSDDVQAGTVAARNMISQVAPSPTPEGNFARNKQYVKPGSANFETKLSPDEEKDFRSWVSENKVPFRPDDRGPQDYDMRGFWKGIQTGDEHAKTGVNQNDKQLHFSDWWKTPYHESFSNESQWAGPNAPRWNERDQLVTREGKVAFDERAPRTPFNIKPADNDIGLDDARSDSLTKFARDGQFVTSHDNSGLNLVYGDKFVKKSDGSPLLLTWPELAKMGKEAPKRFQMSWPRG